MAKEHKQFNLPDQASDTAKEKTAQEKVFSPHTQYSLPDRANVPETAPFEFTAPNVNRTDKDLNIKNRHVVTDVETLVNHGQKIKVTEVLSGATSTHFTKLDEFNISIKDVNISRGVQLPKASLAGLGKVYVVKDISGSASATTIAVNPVDGETIDGDTDDTINQDYEVKRYFTDGSNWFSW